MQGLPAHQRGVLLALSVAVAVVLIWSGIAPKDRFTWFLEVLPALIAWPLLALSYKRFRFTTLTYTFIALHMAVLMVGGHYTYAEVPLFDWVRDVLHTARNDYDRVGHFMQGLVPALVAREILLRGDYVRGRRMTGFLCVCIALAISAVYELIEWWAALALGQGADEFLGTQGDPWDTQSDMFLALIGATFAVFALSRLHDRQLQRVGTIRAI